MNTLINIYIIIIFSYIGLKLFKRQIRYLSEKNLPINNIIATSLLVFIEIFIIISISLYCGTQLNISNPTNFNINHISLILFIATICINVEIILYKILRYVFINYVYRIYNLFNLYLELQDEFMIIILLNISEATINLSILGLFILEFIELFLK